MDESPRKRRSAALSTALGRRHPSAPKRHRAFAGFALGLGLLASLGGACTEHDAADCTSYDCDAINNVGGQGGSGVGDAASVKPGYPCDVYQVLQAKCFRCHGDPTENGAPFSLATWEDTQAEYLMAPRWEAMQNAVETDFMPAVFFNTLEPPLQPPVEGLTPQQKQTMLDWFAAGAPSVAEGCEYAPGGSGRN